MYLKDLERDLFLWNPAVEMYKTDGGGMECLRCGNRNRSFFYKSKAGWYCRKCISFGRVLIQEEAASGKFQEVKEECSEYALQYPLTSLQHRASAECRKYIRQQDVLLECVCGAGKTEMVLASIADALKEGKKVGFAIARRQVVLELSKRLRTYFSKAKIAAVCGGFTKELDGDLIVCTTHQLYRYQRLFSLLILDEPDAFPFRGNEVLHGIAQNACIGHIIYLTATPDQILTERIRTGRIHRIALLKRPHGVDLPVPVIKVAVKAVLFLYLLHWLKQYACSPRIVFVPTVAQAVVLNKILRYRHSCNVCTSHSPDRDEIIRHFTENKNGIVIATTVLERGVTIPGVNICVWHANHRVFDEAGLIQMAGRAGRSFSCPIGSVLFLCTECSELVFACQAKIKQANDVCVV